MAQNSGGRARAAIFLIVSVIAALLATVIIYQLISSYQKQLQEAQKPPETVDVVVAARDLYMGVSITEEDLFMTQIPPEYLPETVFTSKDQVVGRTPRERVLSNEFIRSERLADPDAGQGLNAIIPRGMRAISIDISDGRGGAGFIRPGNYVDVIVTILADESKGRPKPITETLLQAVYVLAVNSKMSGQNGESDSRKRVKPSVTIAVTPEDALKMAHASEEGVLTLSLRNDVDVTHQETHGVKSTDLIGTPQQVTPEPKKPEPVRTTRPTAKAPEPEKEETTLQLYRGTKSETLQVGEDGATEKKRGR